MTHRLPRLLARYLTRDHPAARPLPVIQGSWRTQIAPGDVLLVEGTSRVSTAIRYLTQSTWSHSAMCLDDGSGGRQLIEADLVDGVRLVPLTCYSGSNVRICRPVGLEHRDIRKIHTFMQQRIGFHYDLDNIVDLLRYLLPEPPVPQRWRRKLLTLGSGDPTRAICSTLIAQAFHHIDYPILPELWQQPSHPGNKRYRARHHSFFTPRDFDLSPYFDVVKPTLEQGFDFRRFNWAVRPSESADDS